MDNSPFHAGEKTLQEQHGVREQMETFGRQVIRSYLPDQHQAFYQQLPFVFIGYADDEGNPWATALFGEPGFMHSPDAESLRINTQPVRHDPINDTLKLNTKLGLLGLEPNSRRRNRLAGYVTTVDEAGVSIQVDQAFGNCPQYIQTRSHVANPNQPGYRAVIFSL